MQSFLSGMVTAGFLTASVFFARFWVRTRDLLFAAFSGAFCLLALNQALAALIPPLDERRGYAYALRVVAFLLIVVAIIRKNTSGGGPAS